MSRKLFITFGTLFILSALLIACAGEQGVPGQIGPAGPAGPQGPAGPPGDDASTRLDYVGSEKCGECHENEYAKFVLSGHPYKLTAVDGEAPSFPYDDVTGGVSSRSPRLTNTLLREPSVNSPRSLKNRTSSSPLSCASR